MCLDRCDDTGRKQREVVRLSDTTVFVLVVALRLLVPLGIPRFPLPGIVLALIVDAIDLTLFEQFTSRNLDGYQSYDKALDVYYLTIAYLATMRNWSNPGAFALSRFLFYYRLFGVVLFEYSHARWLLLVFPNTFEYFFIFYEAVRLRWDPRRLSRRVVTGVAAITWIAIKLPQEYWIHIAELDVTEELSAHPGLIPLVIVVLVLVLGAARWLIMDRMPPADHRLSLADPVVAPRHQGRWVGAIRTEYRRLADWNLFEKIVLVSLVSIIFARILPSVSASGLQTTLAVAVLIVGDTVVSEWLTRRGIGWSSVLRLFGATAVINAGLAFAWYYLLPISNGSLHLLNTLFFLLLLTLIVTLYDAYRPIASSTVLARA